ncbi:MAG: hypothetical protein ACR2IK_19335 [Chloroflexota bacterium]
MATIPPPPPPRRTVPMEPGEPSNRWPWLALGLGVLIIGAAVAFFLLNRQSTVNVSVAGAPTQSAVAAAAATPTFGASPTSVPPTVPPSPTLAPTATLAPSPTQVATPTALPAPTSPPPAAAVPPTEPPAPTQVAQPAQAAATEPSAPAQPPQPTASAPATPPPAAPTPPASAPTPTSAPTAFAGQVAGAGGSGNTRADLDAAYGPPAGETPDRLAVYRKGNFEYHAGFVPDPSGRAAVLVGISQAGQAPQPLTLEQATAEAHRLLPRDAQPQNPQQEGNPQFVVERYTSQMLAQALPASVFASNKGQPGQFLVVYVRDAAQSTRISRFIIGPGTDPNALAAQAR